MTEPGWPASLDDILPLVYDELRLLARKYLRSESAGHTLAPTALVHELYLRLLVQRPGGPGNREQFFAIASRMLRRILVDHARRRKAAKRGGAVGSVSLDIANPGLAPRFEDSLLLDDALTALEAVDARAARILDLHYFLGMKAEEIAELVNLPSPQVYQEIRVAKAWLKRYLSR